MTVEPLWQRPVHCLLDRNTGTVCPGVLVWLCIVTFSKLFFFLSFVVSCSLALGEKMEDKESDYQGYFLTSSSCSQNQAGSQLSPDICAELDLWVA